MPDITAAEAVFSETRESQESPSSTAERLLQVLPSLYEGRTIVESLHDSQSEQVHDVPLVRYQEAEGSALLPVCDSYDGATREMLEEVYTQGVLENIAERMEGSAVVECARCHCKNIRLPYRVYVYADECTVGRRYFPHRMDRYTSRAQYTYICFTCRLEGHRPCEGCGDIVADTRLCAECLARMREQERRAADGFASFIRNNPVWRPDLQSCRYGFELEFASIEGRKQIARFMKKDFPLESKSLEVKTDGSVRVGMEFAVGYGSIEQVLQDAESVCKVMQFYPHSGYRAGLHVHASFPEEVTDRQELDKLFFRVCSLWSMLEPLLVVAVPCWRKNNEFAQNAFSRFIPASSIEGCISWGRYYTLNYSSRSRHGTLEFRLFPSSSRADIVCGYIQIIEWIFTYVYNRKDMTEEEWSAGDDNRETARMFFVEALEKEEAPNFRFLSRALTLADVPAKLGDFIVERIGYTLVQNIKMEKEDSSCSMFTDRADRSLPSFSFSKERNTAVLAKLRATFKKQEKIRAMRLVV